MSLKLLTHISPSEFFAPIFSAISITQRGFLLACLVLLAPLAGAQSVNDGFDPAPDDAVGVTLVLENGKLLIAGGFSTIAGQSRAGVARLLVDGRVDTAFANLPVTGGFVSQALEQADGALVISGTFTQVGGSPRMRIARLLANGALDTSFVPAVNGEILAIASDSTGRVLLGGEFTQVNGVARPFLARLNSDGSLDNSFNLAPNFRVRTLLRLRDDRMLVGGSFTLIANEAHNHIARLQANGSIDSSFGLSTDGDVYSLAEQHDRHLLVGGQFMLIGGQARPGLARIRTDGMVDPNFTAFANGPILRILPQRDGRIVLGGFFTTVNNQNAKSLARLRPSGSLDFTLALKPADVSASVLALAQQQDGKLLVGGVFTQIGSVTRSALARYETNGALETTVTDRNVTGVVMTVVEPRRPGIFFAGTLSSVNGSVRNRIAKLLTTHNLDPVFVPIMSATVFAMAVMEDDSILVGGNFTTVDGQSRARLLRFTSIDTLDTNYAPAFNDSVRVIIPRPDGSAYIAGDFTSVNGGTRNRVALLNASGNLENFDVNVDGPVFSMVEIGRNLYIGGNFSNVDGQPRARLARISSALGALDASFNPGANGLVLVLATEPTTNALFVGGTFTEIGGQSRTRLARFEDRGVLTAFAPQVSSDVYSLIPMADGSLYIGGNFGAVNGTARGRVARFDALGNLDPNFDPGFNGQLFGLTASGDGKLWAAGNFNTAQGNTRRGLARLSQAEPARESLTLNGADAIWLRSGVAPELAESPRLFISSDGINYVFSSVMFRTAGGWRARNLSVVPGQTLYLRARGVLAGGISNGSRSRIESTAQVLVGLSENIFGNGFE